MDPSPVAHEYDSRLRHTRLFLWSRRCWHVFWYGYEEPRKVERTNICQYVHTFGLMLVALFSQVLLWGTVVGVLAVLPTYLFGSYGMLKLWGVVGLLGGVVGIVVGIVVGVALGIGATFDCLDGARRKMRGPHFIKVLRDWMRAMKEKTCWQITIVYGDEEKKSSAKGG